MEHRFAYDGVEGEPFQVAEERLLPLTPSRTGAARAAPLDEQIKDALDGPLGAARLEDAARRADRVLLLVDDATRTTPSGAILPHLARRLEAAGIEDGQVTVLVAQGTHRALTADEIDLKLGSCADRWTVEQHDGKDAERLVDAGRTRDGMPIVVNRLLANHDLVLGIGTVGVHGIMGYSGGAKIAMIGACGAATEAWTHWQAATRYQTRELLGVVDNPLRRNLDEAARIVGLDAVLNVVSDSSGNVQMVGYGDPLEVHRGLVAKVQELHTVHVPKQADVVVVEARPAVRDYWQSVKGLYVAETMVRDGGTIILVAPNPEGVAENHPNVVALAGRTYAEIVEAVDQGSVEDIIGAAIAAYTARLRRRARIYLVSSGIDATTTRALGFEPARGVQEALDEVTSSHGLQATVAVLEQGGEKLPVIPEVNAQSTSIPPNAPQKGGD